MDVSFIESSLFQRDRDKYMDDDALRDLQLRLREMPLSGSLIPGSGGFRKVRCVDNHRQKGKRGGLRIVYYFREARHTIYLMMIYSKGEVAGLSQTQLRVLKQVLYQSTSEDK